MARGTSILFLLAVAVVGQALTPSSYFTAADLQRLRSVFEAAQPYGADMQSLHYSILGYALLDEPLKAPKEACDAVKKNVDGSNVESLFYAASAAQSLKTVSKSTCEWKTGTPETVLESAIKEDSTTQTIYHAVAALTYMGVKVDSAKVSKALLAALNTDDSPLSHGYAFLAASHLSGDLSKFHTLIEDIIAQADEVEEKYLQFEGGLHATAVIVDGAYKLATAAKKAPTITEDKVVKFANYFLSRKHVQQLKNAATVLSAIKTLTTNEYHIPISVTLASSVSVSSGSPAVQVRVSNLLGQSVGRLTVTADTARHLGDDAVVLSKTAFKAAAGESSLYELDLMKVKPARGFYRITVNAVPQKPDKRFLGTTGAVVEVKVTTTVAIENVEMGVADKDQSSAAKTTKVARPNKAANVLEADHHQKVMMKFTLRDVSANAPMTAHQTFIRLTNQDSGQEIIFVAEPDQADTYKFDLDVGASAKDFGFLSGKYTMDLIVGDAVIENPFSWTVADVSLTFPEVETSKPDDQYRYAKKPEIKHQFREPEVRPPIAVSNLFTVLILSPLVLLLVLWMRIGVNMSNFEMSLGSIGFHVGLAGIFGLYYCYWVHLSMFDTLRYLGLIGIPTFLFGNRLLSGIAAKRK